MSHLTHFSALSGGGCKPDHRGLEPLTQSRAAQTAALEVTAFSTMDAPWAVTEAVTAPPHHSETKLHHSSNGHPLHFPRMARWPPPNRTRSFT